MSVSVTRMGCTSHTHTDIGSLDHAHIIPTISDAAEALLGEAAD